MGLKDDIGIHKCYHDVFSGLLEYILTGFRILLGPTWGRVRIQEDTILPFFFFFVTSPDVSSTIYVF